MESESLTATDAYSADRATAPRVSLDSMKNKIAYCAYLTVGSAIDAMKLADTTGMGTSLVIEEEPSSGVAPNPLDLLTLCVITMQNGFTVVGKSAPASAANFDPEKGRLFAYEDAIRQLWPL